jgi:starch phosphorylase
LPSRPPLPNLLHTWRPHADVGAHVADGDTWWNRTHAGAAPGGIAYLSAEYGIHESLPIYSGGLGVLSGDHVKSASDLGVPLFAVGLYYGEGYFKQQIDDHGQRESYPHLHPWDAGLRRARGAGGQPLEVFVPLYEHNVRAEVWRVDVGRVPLLLLDTDLHGNRPEHRKLTRRLYAGGRRMRIEQEVLLGIGGVRAVRGMGWTPDVFHMNEGHTAFVVLERFREELHAAVPAEEAWESVRRSCVFTTHTPVPAGHDRFASSLVAEVLGSYRVQLGIEHEELMDLGRVRPGDPEEPLCMTVLALKHSRAANGVAEKHGEVSRAMWRDLWPDRTVDEVPIRAITNGVHAPSWVSREVASLVAEAVEGDLEDLRAAGARLNAIEGIDDAAFWGARRAARSRLVQLVAERTGDVVPDGALILGFARRFAPYKRGDMLVSDPARAVALLGDPDRPVVLVYGGKSHPRDGAGLDIIRNVVLAGRRPELAGRVIFVPDYDIGVGRAMVQGCDVWINNPRRPLEASGTSGQKVAMNGGLNCSTLDGWWIEGFALEPRAGWAVGPPEPAEDDLVGDRIDRDALYSTLMDEVVPLFFDRDPDGMPRRWLARSKAAIAACLPAFNTDRMLADYVRTAYLQD